MARKKRESPSLKKLEGRIEGLKSIDAELSLGEITVTGLEAKHAALNAKLKEYNATLAKCDELLNQLESLEEDARDLTERALAGVASKYGKDSSEYEKAGGRRKSERKKPRRTPVAAQ